MGVTKGGREASHRPGKLNAKTGPPLADILIFSILFVFGRLLLFCVIRGGFVFLATVV